MKQSIKLFFSDWQNKGWFVLNIFCSVMYLMWRIFFTIPFGYGWISVAAGILLLIVEALGMVEALVHYVNMYNVRDYPKPEVPLELYPHVDIFISTYNEDTALVAKTVYACKRMDYPNKRKVHIYVCDDGHRAEMKELAAWLGVHYLDRDTHDGQKAGNLNNAMKHSSSPYIVTFDADMMPQSCFLMETIPYFVDAELRNAKRDPDKQIPLGFLQTPQAFYDLDLFQFNLHSEGKIPNEQDYFYRDIEVARTRTNSCIYGGSNTVISRKALEDIGGFYTDAITEDFATGILIQKKGYVSLGIGKPLASGVSAKDLQDLIQQRARWARGVISTGKKMHIYTAKDLSFGQKMNYWASIWYWYAPIKRFSYIMSPILYAVFGFMIFRCTLWQVLLFWLPMYVTSNISLSHLSNNIRNTKWTSIYEYILFPYLLIPVILETFGFSLKKFKVTSKDVETGAKKNNLLYMIPILILIVLSIIGIINCIRIMFDSGSLGPIVVLFWLVTNLFNMVMCSFFISGRDTYRKTERVEVRLPAKMYVDDIVYDCVTKDISEAGAAVHMAKPHLLMNTDENTKIRLEITDRNYHVVLNCKILFAKEDSKQELPWLYSMEFYPLEDEETLDNLLAICYDRVPTRPQEIKKSEGVYDDLRTNIERRVAPAFFMKRHYPRIEVNAHVPYETERHRRRTAKVIDFNYMCVSFNGMPCAKDIVLVLDGVRLEAKYVRKTRGSTLYEIQNPEEVYRDQRVCDKIMEYLLSIARKEDVRRTVTRGNGEQQELFAKGFNEMELV